MGYVDLPIRDRLESSLSNLSKKQRRVADYILANPTAILFASVVEVAEHTQVDPATVVRFAKKLGFSGFPELREQLRSEHALPVRQPQDLLQLRPANSDGSESIIQRIQEQTRFNVERTLELLDTRTLEAATNHMLAARRVVIIGAGLSRAPALHLARVLQSAQIVVQVLEDWYDLLFDAATISTDDVMFAITAQRYSTVTSKALKTARDVGATTIMLTDATFAPGIQLADVALFFSPRSIAEFYSPVGAAIVIDCLAANLALKVPEKMQEGLDRHVDLAKDHDLSYW